MDLPEARDLILHENRVRLPKVLAGNRLQSVALVCIASHCLHREIRHCIKGNYPLWLTEIAFSTDPPLVSPVSGEWAAAARKG